MKILFKLIIWLLVVIGLGVVAFVGLIMTGESGPSTQQLIDSSRELLQFEQVKPHKQMPVVDFSPRMNIEQQLRPHQLQTENIPSKNTVQSENQRLETIKIEQQEAFKVQQGIAEQRARLTKINAIHTELQAIMKQGIANMDMDTLDKTLLDLSLMGTADGIVGGVNINDLRQNISIAGQISALTREIEEYSNNTANADPNKMINYVEQLQKLQGQLIVPTVNNK
ncbi:MAG: hypothetical protein HRT92_06520 [Piscirickettsiaceae bacterium]|nr:hypothetical protein [Piscirickettsiaceae bacterium]